MQVCSCFSHVVQKQSGKADESAKSNVLFISVDDLNDWLGLMKQTGHPDVKTPNLDRLASRGVYFTNAHCNSSACTPSRLSVMTSLSAVSTGCYTNKSGVQNQNMWNEVINLPAYFRKNGYYTMASGKIERHACHKIDKKYPHQKMWNERMSRDFRMNERVLKDGGGYGGVDFYPFPMGGSPIRHHNAKYRGHSLCAGPLDRDYIPGGKMPDENYADWAIERLNRDFDKPFFLGRRFCSPSCAIYSTQRIFRHVSDR